MGVEDSLLESFIGRKVNVILIEVNSQGNFGIFTKFPLKIGSLFGKGDLYVVVNFFSFAFDVHLVNLTFMAALEQAFPGDNDKGIVPGE